MTHRLQAGQQAPMFKGTTHEGEPIDLAVLLDRKRVWLAFFRHASCPMCNQRLHELSLAWPRMKTDSIELVVVYQSPPRSVQRWVEQRRPPLQLVPDPEMALYELYNLEQSWLGMVSPRVVTKMAAKMVGDPTRLGPMEGPLNRLPADFLIERDGRIAVAHYAKSVVDHISLARVARFLSDEDGGSFLDDKRSPPLS